MHTQIFRLLRKSHSLLDDPRISTFKHLIAPQIEIEKYLKAIK